jgi:hypothetical protein
MSRPTKVDKLARPVAACADSNDLRCGRRGPVTKHERLLWHGYASLTLAFSLPNERSEDSCPGNVLLTLVLTNCTV